MSHQPQLCLSHSSSREISLDLPADCSALDTVAMKREGGSEGGGKKTNEECYTWAVSKRSLQSSAEISAFTAPW